MIKSMNDQLYEVALEYQAKLREIETYKEVMKKPEKRYEGWWADLASDLICLKRIARETYNEEVRLIKLWGEDGQN